MSLLRRNPKRDANELAIMAALRVAGCTVAQLSGKGVPDLIVGRAGKCYLLEVKVPGEKLTPDQERWLMGWDGHYAIVETEIQALEAVGLKRA